jgi:hypothetical protein
LDLSRTPVTVVGIAEIKASSAHVSVKSSVPEQ